jgi:fructose-1,6-bisphosphatase/sedoheptulose 1,7-bisphosphatase-like protein
VNITAEEEDAAAPKAGGEGDGEKGDAAAVEVFRGIFDATEFGGETGGG